MVKPIYLILLALILVAISTLWLMLADVLPSSAGMAHPEIAKMSQGGDGGARYWAIKWPVFWLQTGTLICMLSLIALSVKKYLKTKLGYILLGIGLLSIGIWYKIIASYEYYLENGLTGYFLGFPIPSAWTVYAVWLGGLALCFLYVFGFHRFIYTPEDKAKFKKLVKDNENMGKN